MAKIQPQYQLEDGSFVPLYEAEYDMSFKAYKSDRRKSVIAHPRKCIEAKGICRLPNVIEAYIGSGKIGYVVFAKTYRRPFKHALRFIIPVSSRRVVDNFDTKNSSDTQILTMRAVSPGQTKEHRSLLNRRRYEAVKNGAPVKHRQEARKSRITRLGVAHRPRPKIKSGQVFSATQ